jgi:hypothetical protein
MSGAANQGAYGNAGSGPWGPGAWGQNRQNFGGNGAGPWGSNGYAWWSLSRLLLLAATILGFIFFWPIGLVMLCIAIWNRRMGRWVFGGPPPFAAGWAAPNAPGGLGGGSGNGGGWTPPWAAWKGWCCPGGGNRMPPSSGNHAFDDYRDQTLRRLEEEQREFAAFLERLRFARDKAEFDQFMSERRQPPVPTQEPPHPEA